MTKDQLIKNIKSIVLQQVDNIANNNRAISFFKPMINQIVDKNIYKIDRYVDLIANKEGDIEITNMIDQMVNNAITMEPFKVNVPLLNEIEIGGGFIKFQLPFINKSISFDSNDLENFRRTLLNQ